MKASTILGLLFTIVCVFQIGAYYGARPYRDLTSASSTKAELVRIAAEQGRASVLISALAVGLIFISAALLVAENFRAKKKA